MSSTIPTVLSTPLHYLDALTSTSNTGCFEEKKTQVELSSTPIRPIAAFSLWCKDNRAAIAEKNRNRKNVYKILSARWRNLSAEVKLPYQEKERAMKKAYDEVYGATSKSTWMHDKPPNNAYEVFIDIKIRNLAKSHKHLNVAVVTRELEEIWSEMTEENKQPFEELYLKLNQQNSVNLELRKPTKRTHQNESAMSTHISVFDSPPSDTYARVPASEVEFICNDENVDFLDYIPVTENTDKSTPHIPSSPSSRFTVVSGFSIESTHNWTEIPVDLDDIEPTLTFSDDYPWMEVCQSLGLNTNNMLL